MDTLTDGERIALLEREIDRLENRVQQLKKVVRKSFRQIQMLELVKEFCER